MKSGKKRTKIIITALCLLAVAVGVVFTVRYMKKTEKPPVTSVESVSVSVEKTTAQIISTEEIQTEKQTEKPTEENDKEGTTNKTILNCPESENAYTPTAFEAKLFNAINSKRQENGVAPLNWNDCLHAAAKTRADEAVTLFTHTRPGGKKPSSVLTNKGITFSLFGECLLKGTKENDEGVNLMINGLLKEESQSDTVLSSEYSYAAVAVSLDENKNVNAVILFCNP